MPLRCSSADAYTVTDSADYLDSAILELLLERNSTIHNSTGDDYLLLVGCCEYIRSFPTICSSYYLHSIDTMPVIITLFIVRYLYIGIVTVDYLNWTLLIVVRTLFIPVHCSLYHTLYYLLLLIPAITKTQCGLRHVCAASSWEELWKQTSGHLNNSSEKTEEARLF